MLVIRASVGHSVARWLGLFQIAHCPQSSATMAIVKESKQRFTQANNLPEI
jgi:hypothetical protein